LKNKVHYANIPAFFVKAVFLRKYRSENLIRKLIDLVINFYLTSSGNFDTPSPGLDYTTAKATAADLVPPTPPTSREDKLRCREQLKRRLQELALVSETGTASVIEVKVVL